MEESPEPHGREWRVEPGDPPRTLSVGAAVAVTRAGEEIAALRSRGNGVDAQERAASALHAAAVLGANEHELAVATGLTLEHVRELLRNK